MHIGVFTIYLYCFFTNLDLYILCICLSIYGFLPHTRVNIHIIVSYESHF
jgi:hypothetical protein